MHHGLSDNWWTKNDHKYDNSLEVVSKNNVGQCTQGTDSLVTSIQIFSKQY